MKRWQWMALGCVLTLLGAGCESLPSEPPVIYALGSRDGFASPLNSPLKPARPALLFSGTRFDLNVSHKRILEGLAREWTESKPNYLIAGYAPAGLPEDYARSLSERRALAVRQYLIEQGVAATRMQTLGLGQDAGSAGPTSGVVVIYRQ